jgi:hypothetical protein
MIKKGFVLIGLLLLCGAISGNLFAQTDEFKYSYPLDLDYDYQTNKIQIDTLHDEPQTVFTIQDYYNEPLEFLFVEISSPDTVYSKPTDENGIVLFDLMPGKYEVRIHQLGYKPICMELLVGEESSYNIQLNLGRDESMGLHPVTLWSKKKLSDKELQEIIDCYGRQIRDCSNDNYMFDIQL